MKPSEIEAVLRAELRRIAPEIEIDQIDKTANLREEMDIDSMDFLTLVTALGKQLKLELPEADYPQMDTFSNLLGYLSQKTS